MGYKKNKILTIFYYIELVYTVFHAITSEVTIKERKNGKANKLK